MAKKAARIDDCQRTLALVSPSTTVTTMTVHIPDMLMRANRRQYTQSRVYDFRLKLGSVNASTESNYEIYTLSNAWWVKRAIEMAKGVYLDSTRTERGILDQTGRTAKWGDFIIHATVGAAGNFSNLLQYSPDASGSAVTGTEVATDESIYETTLTSQLKDDDGDEMGFTVLGEDLTGDGAFNIFNQYLLSRQHVNPQDTRASPYQELEKIDEDALVDLKQDGDQAPWDLDAFPDPFVLADTISIDNAAGSPVSSYSQTLSAPLGIVLIRKFNNAGNAANFDGSETFLLQARKGTYKGVHAPAYKAMNGVLGS